jgi:hypothetical protein
VTSLKFLRSAAIFLFPLFVVASANAHESPVDHVGREMRLSWSGGRLHVTYRLILTERAVLLELHAMDKDGDGKISDDERRLFFTARADEIAGKIEINVAGQKLRLHPDGDVALDPALGQTFNFVSSDLTLPDGKSVGELRDFYSRLYPGPYRLIPSDTVAAEAVDVGAAASLDEKDHHAGMVVVRFVVFASAK